MGLLFIVGALGSRDNGGFQGRIDFQGRIGDHLSLPLLGQD